MTSWTSIVKYIRLVFNISSTQDTNVHLCLSGPSGRILRSFKFKRTKKLGETYFGFFFFYLFWVLYQYRNLKTGHNFVVKNRKYFIKIYDPSWQSPSENRHTGNRHKANRNIESMPTTWISQATVPTNIVKVCTIH